MNGTYLNVVARHRADSLGGGQVVAARGGVGLGGRQEDNGGVDGGARLVLKAEAKRVVGLLGGVNNPPANGQQLLLRVRRRRATMVVVPRWRRWSLWQDHEAGSTHAGRG